MSKLKWENTIQCGDCLELMKQLPDGCVDELATDPPYGYSFMGKDWDKAVPKVRVWKECLRVMKPGAFGFILCAPRQDCLSRMIVNLEDAGFWVNFSSVYWAYASGFPKAQNISKMIDKKKSNDEDMVRLYLMEELQGIDKKEIADVCDVTIRQVDHWIKKDESQPQTPSKDKWGILVSHYELKNPPKLNWSNRGKIVGIIETPISWNSGDRLRRIATTPQAKALDGSYAGFQPKPAVEVVLVVMKPLSEKTFVDQALKNGKGISWLDDCRVPFRGNDDKNMAHYGGLQGENTKFGQIKSGARSQRPSLGRFPANLLVQDDVVNDGKYFKTGIAKMDNAGKPYGRNSYLESSTKDYGGIRGAINEKGGSFSRYFDLDRWFAERIKQLPKSVQKTFPFLIVPKASKSEKNKGLEGKEFTRKCRWNNAGKWQDLETKKYGNIHPTVKPLKLMCYLVTLGSRTGDVGKSVV